MIDIGKKSIKHVVEYMINNTDIYLQVKWLREAIINRGYKFYNVDYNALYNHIITNLFFGTYKDNIIFNTKDILENDELYIYMICITLGTDDKIILDVYLYEYRRIDKNNIEIYYMLADSHNIPEWG